MTVVSSTMLNSDNWESPYLRLATRFTHQSLDQRMAEDLPSGASNIQGILLDESDRMADAKKPIRRPEGQCWNDGQWPDLCGYLD